MIEIFAEPFIVMADAVAETIDATATGFDAQGLALPLAMVVIGAMAYNDVTGADP